ncbi:MULTISPECIES: VOC family protein [unclassified Rhizobium]|uniref:VOC family protein n=1 Tax=unclassified Rhizobium TaxID=2613769 RepID=UPI0006FB3354|nr:MULTISPECIES: VOC family protein [unclassified Rhizobium]KQV39141.1 glyoxalase [Rhizobium sp. Root1212]KRD35115.1 glyoxalase [Rhizobium sp. Root268]
MTILGLDHIQLAMPAGQEDTARTFYRDLLGMQEVEKPPHLVVRGGCWFGHGGIKIHLGIDPNFTPARKAHPGLLVDDLARLCSALEAAGFETVSGQPLEGYARRYVSDPFGNRIELMQAD